MKGVGCRTGLGVRFGMTPPTIEAFVSDVRTRVVDDGTPLVQIP